ncbi:DUF317 domain-containing protein [Streptomyces microflavus]|uniref:DUF317 domain-containing protein n=1 Tax=Streptomyces microflavus TaxID=1919 RepID=UPI0038124050
MPESTPLNGGDVYVSPRYLAGLPGHGDPSFDPVAHWPRYSLDEGECQLVIASPDHRIKIGWFGDGYDVWQISASKDAVSAPTWTARINQNTPPELVHGLTSALAEAYDAGGEAFLKSTSYRWTDGVQPLLEAGWERMPLAAGFVNIVAPDNLAGATIDVVRSGSDAETWTLWAGPPGWGTRAEIVFTARTPKHLIAATAAGFLDPAPVVREKRYLDRQLAQLATLTPTAPVPATSTRKPVGTQSPAPKSIPGPAAIPASPGGRRH